MQFAVAIDRMRIFLGRPPRPLLASVLQAASPRGIPTFASAYGNPRPPSWMTPNSCAGGLPGFDPSGFKLGDVDVKPKFKFNLGKIKFKF